MLLARRLLVVLALGLPGTARTFAEDAGPKVPPPEPEQAVEKQAEQDEAPAIKTTLSLLKSSTGAISGQWTEKKGDAVSVRQIKAADLDALKKDFADAATLLEAAGGLDVIVPADQARSVSTTNTVNNGRRKTVIKAGPVETTLEENQGKDLRMRVVTRKPDGVEIVEHEAPSLEALKKLDAEAGKQFEEKRGGGAAGRIQVQIRAGGVPPQMQQLFINRGFSAPPVDRTISSYFRGTEVRIVENPETGIAMKVTRQADGQPKTEEFTAKDLKDLERQSVEAAALYRRFTGEE